MHDSININTAYDLMKLYSDMVNEWADGWSDVAEVGREMKYAMNPEEDQEEILQAEQTIYEMSKDLNKQEKHLDNLRKVLDDMGIIPTAWDSVKRKISMGNQRLMEVESLKVEAF